MKKNLKLFLGLEYFLFISVFSYLLYFQTVKILYVEVVFFIMVLFLCCNLSLLTNTGKDLITSINLPILMSAMTLGPFWTGIIAFIGSIKLHQITDVFKWYQFVFNQTVMFMAAGLGSLVFKIFVDRFDSVVIPFLFATIVYFIINNGLVYIVISISNSQQIPSVVRYYFELLKSFVPSFFLGLLLYFGYLYFGKIIFVLGIILIYIIKDFLFTRFQLINSFTQIVESFLKVIDSKDHYTEGHCERVANYTQKLGETMDLRKGTIDKIINMAKIHDIGKIYVDDKILKKSDNLTDAEYEEMKRHSRYGFELLQDIDLLKEDLDIILHHHERYDGTGYPEGIKEEEIPLGSRILSVCDAFDVMTTGRTYKPPLNKKEVIHELKDCSAEQFDPHIADKMITLIKKGKFDDSFVKEMSENSSLQQTYKTAEVNE